MTASRSKKKRSTPESTFLLPKPPRGRTALVVGAEPSAGEAVLRHRLDGLATMGARLVGLLECQDRFLAELRTALGQLQHGLPPAVGDSPLQTAERVVDWCEAVQADLTVEAQRAAAGQQPIDLLALCHDVQHDLQLDPAGAALAAQPLQVHGYARHTVWGDVAELADLLHRAIGLVRRRTGGHGAILVEVAEAEAGASILVRGSGALLQEPPVADIEAFRTAARATGVAVRPDELGAAAPGLVLCFCADRRGPLVELEQD